jgi:hypothetical protein
VLSDGEGEAVFANVAPGADSVGDDGDGVFGHGKRCWAEGHQGSWLVVCLCLVVEGGVWWAVLLVVARG